MSEVTELLERWSQGQQEAMGTLLPLVYQELRALAASRMRGEGEGHTLQPTALIHEAYLRLVAQQPSSMKNRAQFFALAARMMRRILIDHARAKNAGKRGGADTPRLGLTDAGQLKDEGNLDPLVLHDALVNLTNLDPDLCLLVELRHFGGFDIKEISEIMGRPEATVYRHWKLAKAYLYRYFREAAVER